MECRFDLFDIINWHELVARNVLDMGRFELGWDDWIGWDWGPFELGLGAFAMSIEVGWVKLPCIEHGGWGRWVGCCGG